ncbi:hypothetical protein HME9302_01165 [Alteripontixanthobacter maritimus]|uniref:Protein ImuA n=1 Tax=Alteripontixanthobacter maritimus TaxID=2161824 RepID=A0A369Q9N5_9SPHN|nr:hypothetical protein [Alteripontixanthobacter maritimus]RDC59967.1 hypothetical protein HME9302_01165 [Alteripontixanthobacter maritimus]
MIDKLWRYQATSSTALRVPANESASAEPTLQEAFASGGDASAIGLALSQINAGPHASLLWVQDRQAIREMGRMFLHGIPSVLGQDVIHITASNGREALWAMAEGLKCAELGAVIGEIHGDPRALDFTATRRLAVAAEQHGVPAFLVRINGHADLSGARRRWRVKSRPSLPHPHDKTAPGAPVWSLDLFRARDMQPTRWDVSYDGTAHRLDLVSADGDGPLEEETRQAG